jgi:hypothetical protein
MIYYLEDSATRSIVFISDDILLTNNVASGILDVYLRSLKPGPSVTTIKEHLTTKFDTGIAFSNGGFIELDLTDFSYTKEKLRLVRLRKPLFEELLINVQKATASNKIGFIPGEEFYIQHALRDDNALEEYALVLNMSLEFAKKELELISESVIKNNFRIFTIATLLREKINTVSNEEEADAIKLLLASYFNRAGVINV